MLWQEKTFLHLIHLNFSVDKKKSGNNLISWPHSVLSSRNDMQIAIIFNFPVTSFANYQLIFSVEINSLSPSFSSDYHFTLSIWIPFEFNFFLQFSWFLCYEALQALFALRIVYFVFCFFFGWFSIEFFLAWIGIFENDGKNPKSHVILLCAFFAWLLFLLHAFSTMACSRTVYTRLRNSCFVSHF